MNQTELFDEIMKAYGLSAEETLQLAGKNENLAGAVLRAHSAGFIRFLNELLQPDAEQSQFSSNIALL